jgi:hypothetical protein
MAGRTEAIAKASKASKNVAVPMMTRVLTCHHDTGSRSMRATTCSAETVEATEYSVDILFSPLLRRTPASAFRLFLFAQT